jgi:hypothetical protein
VVFLAGFAKGAWYSCSTSKRRHRQLLPGERKGLERAKQEAKTREKKPRGLIEYYFARGGPLLQQIGKRKFHQPASF